MTLPRISLRASLVGVAVVAFGLFGVLALLPILWLLGMGDGTYHGPNTDILEPGRAVVLAAEFRAAPSSRVLKPTGHTDFKEVRYDWSVTTPEGQLAIARGTRGVVELDPAWDDDSCWPDRPIAVEIAEGEHRGSVVALPRRLLRGR
ncbi:hypothetical protein AB1L88_16475 [Tautonia sp. JC769]|uniref:hypothetical protein n=1 Tax=Tautonia sp. JC769 TaxID=3232135 RepID=UPI0034599193